MDASVCDAPGSDKQAGLAQKRKDAAEALRRELENGGDGKDALWLAVRAFEGCPFKTTSGLDFTYSFKQNRYGQKGNEIVVSRKEKTITRSSVELALDAVRNAGAKTGYPVRLSTPKELSVFGASYLYPLFIRLGLVEHIGSHRRGGRRKKSEALKQSL